MRDEIVLTLPRERRFHDVAHLVLGGLAMRLNLTIEHLEDLQVALDGVLPVPAEGDVTVVLGLGDGALSARIGPFDRESLEQELERTDGVGLRRVLETVADGWRLDDRDGARWILLTKGTQA